jgi:hypothetical protein
MKVTGKETVVENRRQGRLTFARAALAFVAVLLYLSLHDQ